MNKSKWQRLLGAALVAALLITTLAPAAIAAVPAAVAQQVSDATEVTALLPGGQFDKIWLAITPDNPGTVTVTAEWDRPNALETGVGFYVLDENNLSAVVNGASLPANNVGSGSSDFFLNGASNMQGSSFNATAANYTVVIYNDSNSDANVTLRVDNATISDDSGRVLAPGAAPAAEATAATTETMTDTTTVTDTVTDTATIEATTEATVAATAATTETATTTETVAAATPAATVVTGGPVRAETMEGSLPEQFSQHFLGLEPSVRDGAISLVLTYDPQDSIELARRINFWVLDTAGFRSYQDGESASAVAIAAGSRSFTEPETSNRREASFNATGFGPYTVIVQNNSRVPATYQLAATGGVLIDDSAQTLTAQQATGTVTATTTTTGTTAATTTTVAATTATTTTASTGVTGTPGGTYTVQSGDTLAIIARDIYGDYRLYEQLCAFNNIADCNVIEVGQVINLPTEAEVGSVSTTAAAATPAATTAAATAATPAATAAVTTTAPVTSTETVTTTSATTSTTSVGATGATTTTATTTAASGTLMDVLEQSGDFTIFLSAVEQAGLQNELDGTTPVTVFAPTDAAFESLLTSLSLTEDRFLQIPELAQLLELHMVPGRLLVADLTEGQQETTLQGSTVKFTIPADGVKINDSYIVSPDVRASNGVLQAIDKVMLLAPTSTTP